MVDYEGLSLRKLDKVNKSNKLAFFVTFIALLFCGGFAFLYSYSFDPVLAFNSVAVVIGFCCVLVVNFFVYGKLVLLLRLIAGDEDDS